MIVESGCRVIVVSPPKLKSSQIISDNSLQIIKIIQEYGVKLKELVIFLNIELESELEDVHDFEKTIELASSKFPFNSVGSTFIKLDIFDKNSICPSDNDVYRILHKSSPETQKMCIPFLIGKEEVLQTVVSYGCPAVRIWCSDIGQGEGIIDEIRLKRIVSSVDIPLILEGGLSTPNHVQRALFLGFTAVLMNSSFRCSLNPVKLAQEIRNIVYNIDK